MCPGGSDETFLDRLFSHYGDRGKINFPASIFILIMNFTSKAVVFTRYICYRSSNASAKSAGQQSIRFATFTGNKSCALHRDRLA